MDGFSVSARMVFSKVSGKHFQGLFSFLNEKHPRFVGLRSSHRAAQWAESRNSDFFRRSEILWVFGRKNQHVGEADRIRIVELGSGREARDVP